MSRSAHGRERATEVVEQITGAPWDVFTDAEWQWVDLIATALAAERAKARAPFHKLLTFYDRHEYSSLNVDDLRRALDGDR
jgi:hypothetical protein